MHRLGYSHYVAQGGDVGASVTDAMAQVTIPVGFTTFPGEIFQAPRTWVEKTYPHRTYFHQGDRGGHLAAWEEPELFADEVRAAFRPLRSD